MEPQVNHIESVITPLKKVTPLSKYLALVLFIILPFLGGWIGYTYAPEKVVEVIVKKEAIRESQKVTPEDNEKYSFLPTYSSMPTSEFIDLDSMLALAPFDWVKNDAYREYNLFEFMSAESNLSSSDDLHSGGCYAHPCRPITIVGDRYTYRITNDSSSEDALDNFRIDQLGDYLSDNDFSLLYEIGKGWQFGEVYQKTINGTSMVIGIYSKPISLSFPDDDSYPTAQGSEFRVFVGTPFTLE